MARLLLTVPEAAEALAISRSTVYELIAAGLIRSVRIDGSRRVPVEALETYLAVLLSQEDLTMSKLRNGVIKLGSQGRPASPRPARMTCGTCMPPRLAGVPVHLVAARLGHADPAVTLRVYSHVLREHAAGIGDIFAQAITPRRSRLLLAKPLARQGNRDD